LLPHHYMAPHVLISWLWKHWSEDFMQKILGTAGALAEFWAGVPRADPRLEQLRKDHPEYAKWCVPIVVHGDGVPCTKNHTLDTLSFESLLTKRSVDKHYSTLDYIFFMSGVFNQTMVSDDAEDDTSKGLTKTEMWQPLVHSLRAMYFGKWPTKDPTGSEIVGPQESDSFTMKGQALAGGYSFVCWVNKGDMDFHINHYQQPGHWSSNNPCPACQCTREEDSPMRWNNFSPETPQRRTWKSSTFTSMTAYSTFCRSKGKQVHLIFKPLSQGGLGMHVMSQYKDALHVGDMGVTKHACGNVLWLLCYTDVLGEGMRPADKMARVWGEICDLYKARGTSSQYSHLSLASFCDPEKPRADYPVLKGKGAEMRHLLPILKTIWAKYARSVIHYEQHVLQVLNRLHSFYVALDFTQDGMFPFHLPLAVSEQILIDIDALLQHWALLSRQSVERNLNLWHVVPKHHYLWHLAQEASHLNPRMSWCYANEDFVGKLATVGLSTRHGQAAAYRSKQLVEKYILGITLRMFHSLLSSRPRL
jgi:hypothetical protein